MLEIVIPGAKDDWDPINEEFVNREPCRLRLEHSLISISKWEAKWHIPFLDREGDITDEQLRDYIRCMTLTQNVDPDVYKYLSKENMDEIQEYITNPMTATWFGNNSDERPVGKGRAKQVVTSELIYYWMIAQNIPVEFEKWHLSRLMTLIQVCSIKNKEAEGGSKKMSKNQIYNQNKSLNAARRAKLHTKG